MASSGAVTAALVQVYAGGSPLSVFPWVSHTLGTASITNKLHARVDVLKPQKKGHPPHQLRWRWAPRTRFPVPGPRPQAADSQATPRTAPPGSTGLIGLPDRGVVGGGEIDATLADKVPSFLLIDSGVPFLYFRAVRFSVRFWMQGWIGMFGVQLSPSCRRCISEPGMGRHCTA